MRKQFLLQVFGGILMVFVYLAPQTGAAELSASDHSEFQRIITAQIKAFQTGDGTGAYDFAAPGVQNLFPNARSFVAMVKRNYKPVFRPQSFNFEAVSFKLGKPTQRLTVVGPAGVLWVAFYGFERQKDNSWKIAGVVLFRHKGMEAVMSDIAQTEPVNRRTVLKRIAATLAVVTVGIPVLARAQLDPVAKAHEFIQRTDALDFRWFVHESGSLGFREGTNSIGPMEDSNWPEILELMKNEEPPEEAMMQALDELGRIEPPYTPPNMSNYRMVYS